MVAQNLSDAPQTGKHITSITLAGPVDRTTVPGIRNRLLGCAKKRETKALSIEMSQVTQLDTAGVAMLVELWKCMARRGGELSLSGLSENAKRLLHLAGLDQVLSIKDDNE